MGNKVGFMHKTSISPQTRKFLSFFTFEDIRLSLVQCKRKINKKTGISNISQRAQQIPHVFLTKALCFWRKIRNRNKL